MKIHKGSTCCIAEIISPAVEIHDAQDALDLMADAGYQGAIGLVVRRENLVPGFFDLSTGIAGEILQKFSTYAFRLAIVGDFSTLPGKSLRDFIFESNKIGRVLFLGSVEEVMERWGKR